MIRVGAAAFDGVDGRISPDGSEMWGDSIENKQVELIMSDRWFRGTGRSGPHVGLRPRQRGVAADAIGVPFDPAGARSGRAAALALYPDGEPLPASGRCLSLAGLA